MNSLTISPTSTNLFLGSTVELDVTISPYNATHKRIEWSSDDTNIAEVNANGCVTGKSAGTTCIRAYATDGSGVYGCCDVMCSSGHPDSSSYVYHATVFADGDEYTFTCEVPQCDDSFTVPKDQVVGSYVTSDTNPHLGNSQTPLAYGIDVSKWQDEISQDQWNAIANTQIDGHTITFAILRIGRELNPINGAINRQKDPYFENNYERAKAARLHVGCYYLTESCSADNAIADAEQVIEWIGNKQFEYPIFFNIESNLIKNNVSDKATRTEICTAFMNKMREVGFFTGLYADNEWINDHLNSSTLFPEYDFWYARYYDNTPNNWQAIGRKQAKNSACGSILIKNILRRLLQIQWTVMLHTKITR